MSQEYSGISIVVISVEIDRWSISAHYFHLIVSVEHQVETQDSGRLAMYIAVVETRESRVSTNQNKYFAKPKEYRPNLTGARGQVPACRQAGARSPSCLFYSHSMVPGGLLVRS